MHAQTKITWNLALQAPEIIFSKCMAKKCSRQTSGIILPSTTQEWGCLPRFPAKRPFQSCCNMWTCRLGLILYHAWLRSTTFSSCISGILEQLFRTTDRTRWTDSMACSFSLLKTPRFLSLGTSKVNQTHHTYSVKHNVGLFKFKLCLYMHATYFGPFSGHHQACQYKNLTEGDKTR